MVTVTSIIVIVLYNMASLVNSDEFSMCFECANNGECHSENCVEPGICTFGPIGGQPSEHPPPLCSSDLFCLYWDGNFIKPEPDTPEEVFEPVIGASCLRCCPMGENGANYCRETVSTGQDSCGVIVEHFQAFGSVAPCCPGDVCLDNVAGICGDSVDEACGECMRWSYVIGDEQFDNFVGDIIAGIAPFIEPDRPLF
eukprot:66368_1